MANKKSEKEKKTEEQNLPSLTIGESIPKLSEQVKKNQTKPPSPYISASLIKKMSQLGLGTQATRANFEPLLQKRGYITQSRELHVTEAGKMIIEAGIGKLQFANPEFTAKQEKYLDEIARGKRDHRKAKGMFLERIKEVAKETVDQILTLDIECSKVENAKKRGNVIGKCLCGGNIVETAKTYRCEKCGKYVFKTVYGKRITKKQAESLINGKKVKVKGLKSKAGKKYSATLFLAKNGDKWNIQLDFGRDMKR